VCEPASRTDPQLFPRPEAAFQRCRRRSEQQSQSHYEKILRVPHLPLPGTRALSLTWQIARARITPRFFLTNHKKEQLLPATEARQSDRLRYLCAAYADLDIYNVSLGFGAALAAIVKRQDENIIPPASCNHSQWSRPLVAVVLARRKVPGPATWGIPRGIAALSPGEPSNLRATRRPRRRRWCPRRNAAGSISWLNSPAGWRVFSGQVLGAIRRPRQALLVHVGTIGKFVGR
jgi:hypothetical protein